jgi:hypothetical protein
VLAGPVPHGYDGHPGGKVSAGDPELGGVNSHRLSAWPRP